MMHIPAHKSTTAAQVAIPVVTRFRAQLLGGRHHDAETAAEALRWAQNQVYLPTESFDILEARLNEGLPVTITYGWSEVEIRKV